MMKTNGKKNHGNLSRVFFLFHIMNFCDIMFSMKRGILSFLIVSVAMHCGAAPANWQYSGEYTYNMYEYDTGGRASVSIRGGASYAMSKMSNDTTIVFSYCVNPTTGEIQDWTGECDVGFEYATGGLGQLGMSKISEINFSGGASIGWILPEHPQWRMELGWDHFAEVDYNKTPLFSGDMELSNGTVIRNFNVGGVQSTMSTDLISVMAFYDFFDGYVKPAHTMIPYVGIGFGYADTKTVMNFYDPTGDLGFNILQDFGVVDDGTGVIDFYKSTTNTSNIAGVAALGFSYGLVDNLFLDFGARVSYLPRVNYRLTNSDGSRHLDWFSAKNLIYTNVMLGVRLEF